MIPFANNQYRALKQSKGPTDFGYAVKQARQKPVAWLKSLEQAEHLAWTLNFQELLKKSHNRTFITLLAEYLDKLRERL